MLQLEVVASAAIHPPTQIIPDGYRHWLCTMVRLYEEEKTFTLILFLYECELVLQVCVDECIKVFTAFSSHFTNWLWKKTKKTFF